MDFRRSNGLRSFINITQKAIISIPTVTGADSGFLILNRLDSMKKTEYYLYALILSKKAVYVGLTTDIKRRVIEHKQTKQFDRHIVIKKFLNRKDAHTAENAIIRFLGIFGGSEIINSLHQNDLGKRLHIGL